MQGTQGDQTKRLDRMDDKLDRLLDTVAELQAAEKERAKKEKSR
jgi:hypothetical protein